RRKRWRLRPRSNPLAAVLELVVLAKFSCRRRRSPETFTSGMCLPRLMSVARAEGANPRTAADRASPDMMDFTRRMIWNSFGGLVLGDKRGGPPVTSGRRSEVFRFEASPAKAHGPPVLP